MAPRTCCQCGKEFLGGPSARYCPECRIERRREANRRCKVRQREGRAIVLGETIGYCAKCGKEFVYTGAKQKYCSGCSKEAIREADRKRGRGWLARAVKKYGRQYADDRNAVRRVGREVCVDCGAPLEAGHAGNKKYCPSCKLLHKEYVQHSTDRKRAGRQVNEEFEEWKTDRIKGQTKCPVCGRFFVPQTKRQKYCSKECTKRAAAKRALEAYHKSHPRPVRICPICGRKFLNGEHHYEKYCSPECRSIGRRQKMAARLLPDAPPIVTKPKWKPKPTVEKICPICGKKFATTYSQKKYCSKTCRDKEMIRRAIDRNRNRAKTQG